MSGVALRGLSRGERSPVLPGGETLGSPETERFAPDIDEPLSWSQPGGRLPLVMVISPTPTVSGIMPSTIYPAETESNAKQRFFGLFA